MQQWLRMYAVQAALQENGRLLTVLNNKTVMKLLTGPANSPGQMVKLVYMAFHTWGLPVY